MKKLIFIFSLVFASVISITAQNTCPVISVTGPSSIIPIGDSMTFTANVEGIDISKIQFEWEFDKGTIAKGQGTSTITGMTNADIAGQTVTATVKISGLPQNCPNEVYGVGEVAPQPPRIIWDPKVDEYVKLTWREEKVRLSGVAIELSNNGKTIAYFIVNTNEKNYSRSLKIREAKIKTYLFEKYKIARDRIRVVYGGTGASRTVIWLVPVEALPPDTEEEKPKPPPKKRLQPKQKIK